VSGAAIETEQLTKIYTRIWSRRPVRAVDGISLCVPEGATFGLLGPNGAGKTTFVKMLLSAVRPTAGQARIFGLPSNLARARQPVGYLPENHRFPTYYTAAGMLDCYAALSGVSATERRKRIPQMLERVGLAGWEHVRLGKYSKGMLQRVGLAQALIHQPRLLILDEPTDGVDPLGRIHIREILTELEKQGVTIFLNSHLLAEVELFCQSVAILHRGKVVLEGRVRELTSGQRYRLRVESPDGLTEHFYNTRSAANEALDQFRRQGCAVESLQPETSTLERVFLEAVRGAQGENP
jgi:ABC-2 type transport system ATP-binding protein